MITERYEKAYASLLEALLALTTPSQELECVDTVRAIDELVDAKTALLAGPATGPWLIVRDYEQPSSYSYSVVVSETVALRHEADGSLAIPLGALIANHARQRPISNPRA